ncbi:MAG: hypothetical protein MUC95_05725, partial [Spirochaetes bacterium]|nr:hypothetical protein [Spirochaetota bacterium]
TPSCRQGHGLCGRELCCVYLKEEFDPVSIKMAKEQNLNLNSLKISGMCGRLLCCLGYEYDVYKELNESMPKTDIKVEVGDKMFTVISTEPLRGTVRLINADNIIEVNKNDIIKEGDKFKITSKALQAINTRIKKEDADNEDDMPNYKL